MSKEAMKLAIEALKFDSYYGTGKQEAIKALEEALSKSEQDEPVLIVEKEPDYMSGGHFHNGTKPYIDPTKVWALPIGTKLYAITKVRDEA